MSNGTVKFFNNTKGFGFITPDEGGKDVFVHQTGLTEEIREGDKVSYDVQEGQKGLNAGKRQSFLKGFQNTLKVCHNEAGFFCALFIVIISLNQNYWT